VTRNGIVTSTGAVHEVDVIIMATGFQASKLLWPMDIRGRDGMTIRSVWGDDDPRAYKGMSVPGFPNLFVIAGPNTSLSHGGSAVFHTECQVTYITKALREMIERGYDSMEVRPEVHDAYNRLVDEKHSKMVWTHRGVTSWYKNKSNRVTMTSPWRLVDFWRLTHEFVAAEYVCAPALRRAPREAATAPATAAAVVGE
jgi:4-hydroxyacetophenone monooxygenase